MCETLLLYGVATQTSNADRYAKAHCQTTPSQIRAWCRRRTPVDATMPSIRFPSTRTYTCFGFRWWLSGNTNSIEKKLVTKNEVPQRRTHTCVENGRVARRSAVKLLDDKLLVTEQGCSSVCNTKLSFYGWIEAIALEGASVQRYWRHISQLCLYMLLRTIWFEMRSDKQENYIENW